MLQVATWLRANDEALFARFFAGHRTLRLENARLGTVDLASASGVMISGGPDISAEFHVEPPVDPSLIQDPDPIRDGWEFQAIRLAMERGLPLFCVCKGFQVLNIALGGTLHLDIRGHDLPELKSQNLQRVRYSTDARHRFDLVNSSHHQALDRVADALEVEGWCVDDDVIEQVRIRNYPWGVGVQYHPERDVQYKKLFDDFAGQVATYGNGNQQS